MMVGRHEKQKVADIHGQQVSKEQAGRISSTTPFEGKSDIESRHNHDSIPFSPPLYTNERLGVSAGTF